MPAPFEPAPILLPALALIGWTFAVLLIPYRRFKASFAGQVTAADFRVGESVRVPPEVRVPNRVFMNLLEMPVLFYVLVAMRVVARLADAVFVTLAWGYVALRGAHSLIYLGRNDVIWRFVAFALSNVLVVTIWGRLCWMLLA